MIQSNSWVLRPQGLDTLHSSGLGRKWCQRLQDGPSAICAGAIPSEAGCSACTHALMGPGRGTGHLRRPWTRIMSRSLVPADCRRRSIGVAS